MKKGRIDTISLENVELKLFHEKKVELKLFHEKGTNETDKKLSNSFLIWDKKNWEIEKFDKSKVLVTC